MTKSIRERTQTRAQARDGHLLVSASFDHELDQITAETLGDPYDVRTEL